MFMSLVRTGVALVAVAVFVVWFSTVVLRGDPAAPRASSPVAVKATDAKVRTSFQVQQGEWMNLDVQGKWRMWNSWDYTGAQGHEAFQKINALGYLGALVVQIDNGAPFVPPAGTPFQAPAKGEVHLYANRQGYTHLPADGELKVVVQAGPALQARLNQDNAAAAQALSAILADAEIQQTLRVLNEARRTCGLAEVKPAPAHSVGCQKHSQYLLANKGHPATAGLKAHEEDRSLPGWSEEGARAGKNSVIHYVPPSQAIKGWLATFYHRVPLLQPGLAEVGIGYAHQGTDWVCGIDCLSGRPAAVKKDVVCYPDEGQRNVPLNLGDEIPNPLPAGQTGPAGFPITAAFDATYKVANVQFRLVDGKNVEVPCHVSTPERPATSFPQWNSVCAIPRQPLTKGTTYRVDLQCSLSGKPFARKWSFVTE